MDTFTLVSAAWYTVPNITEKQRAGIHCGIVFLHWLHTAERYRRHNRNTFSTGL